MNLDVEESIVNMELEFLYTQHRMPSGIFGSRVELRKDVYDYVCVTLRAYVLSEQAGPIEEKQTVYDVARFPRWLSKWLQRRWTTTQKFSLKIEPRYIYPNSSVAVPDLNKPIRISRKTTS